MLCMVYQYIFKIFICINITAPLKSVDYGESEVNLGSVNLSFKNGKATHTQNYFSEIKGH